MRCGMILRSSEGDVKLDGFEIPELDSRYLVIKADDIPGANEIRIFDTVMPLLASDYIAYKGQPLLVLFGPDYETTELARFYSFVPLNYNLISIVNGREGWYYDRAIEST